MRNRQESTKLNILKLLLVICITLPSFGDEIKSFLDVAKKYVGEYEVIKSNSRFCDSGTLAFLNSSKPKDGLRIGQTIFFGPFSKEKQIEKTSDGCKSTSRYKFENNKVTQFSEIIECPKNFKKLEAKSTQVLSFSDEQVSYHSVESKIKCIFKRKKGGN